MKISLGQSGRGDGIGWIGILALLVLPLFQQGLGAQDRQRPEPEPRTRSEPEAPRREGVLARASAASRVDCDILYACAETHRRVTRNSVHRRYNHRGNLSRYFPY